MKTILLMDIVIVFVGIYLAVSAAKMKKSGQISDASGHMWNLVHFWQHCLHL